MERREFLMHLAAGAAATSILLPGIARAEPTRIGIVPVGKRGRILANELVNTLAGSSLAQASVIDAQSFHGPSRQLDGVVIFGCLGGRTGMADAAACGTIARRATGGATAVLLWPMEFEGSRRRATAHFSAGRIGTHGIDVIPVRVEVPRHVTLNEARELRERVLLDRGFREIERFIG